MWVWDGTEWRYANLLRWKRPGLFWFFSVPNVAGDLVLMALIGLIPFVGTMVVFGWYLAARDHMRAGHWVVPRASFDHMERGVAPFVAQLVYGLYGWALYIVIGLGFIVAIVLSAPALVFVALAIALFATWLAVTLVTGFLFGAIIALAGRDGIGAACNPLRTLDLAVANAGPSWRVFGRYLVGALIGIAFSVLIPFAAALVLPAAVLMAVPAQADLDETVRSPALQIGTEPRSPV